ncbi:MAG: hypothetical protein IT393_07020 [Nitrospirae bacterium]|nr:hypothetical protein [Nitrospirota bacterium]
MTGASKCKFRNIDEPGRDLVQVYKLNYSPGKEVVKGYNMVRQGAAISIKKY